MIPELFRNGALEAANDCDCGNGCDLYDWCRILRAVPRRDVQGMQAALHLLLGTARISRKRVLSLGF